MNERPETSQTSTRSVASSPPKLKDPQQIRAQSIGLWKKRWPAKQAKHSQYPIEFWQRAADEIMAGREPLDNNPLLPIGNYADNWPGSTEFLVSRNNIGIEHEQAGDIELAIFIYELSVADEFFGTHPYDRLRIIYAKRKMYTDAIRVCEAYLALPDRPNGQNKPHFQHHLDKLTSLGQGRGIDAKSQE